MTVRSRLRTRTLLRCRFRRLRRLRERWRLRSAPAGRSECPALPLPAAPVPCRCLLAAFGLFAFRLVRLLAVRHRSWRMRAGCVSMRTGLGVRTRPALAATLARARGAGVGAVPGTAGRVRAGRAVRPCVRSGRESQCEQQRRGDQDSHEMFGRELRWPSDHGSVSFGRGWSAACGGRRRRRRHVACIGGGSHRARARAGNLDEGLGAGKG